MLLIGSMDSGSGFRTESLGRGTRNSRAKKLWFGVWVLGSGVWGRGLRVWSQGSGMWGVACTQKIQGSEHRAWFLGVGFWGLGLGVRG